MTHSWPSLRGTVLGLSTLLLLAVVALHAASAGRAPDAGSSASAATASGAVGFPVRIKIPSLAVDAPIVGVGKEANGDMAMPDRPDVAGWYSFGSKPGENGSAVIAGHLDTLYGAPAIFWHLKDLQPGNVIITVDSKGMEQRFTVQRTASFAADRSPVEAIFAPSLRKKLNLITCHGAWSWKNGEYTERLVIFSQQDAQT